MFSLVCTCIQASDVLFIFDLQCCVLRCILITDVAVSFVYMNVPLMLRLAGIVHPNLTLFCRASEGSP